VGPGIPEEDLLEVERDALRALELRDLGVMLGEVVAVDLRRATEREMGNVECREPLGVTRAGVEARVVAVAPQVAREAGER
jgi:hypothetical protein